MASLTKKEKEFCAGLHKALDRLNHLVRPNDSTGLNLSDFSTDPVNSLPLVNLVLERIAVEIELLGGLGYDCSIFPKEQQ